MKIRKVALLFLLFFISAQLRAAATTNNKQTPTDLKTASEKQKQAVLAVLDAQKKADEAAKKMQAQVAALAFPANMPTISSNEKIIDKIYGSTGLKLASQSITQIKNCYCYLEFLIKLNKVQNDQSFAKYKTDFQDFLLSTTHSKPLMPTQKLVQSDGWKAIQITSQDIINSSMWQNFIKAMICDTLTTDTQIIADMSQANNQIFSCIPNIETAYNNNDFAQTWLYQESMQLQITMSFEQRNRYLQQSIDWKDLTTSKLIDAANTFKKTDFYTITHNALPATNNSSSQTPAMTSPTQEQILCYFMLVHIQTLLYDSMTSNNVISVLTQSDSTELVPNFFSYRTSDIIYFNDYFALQTIQNNQKINPPKQSTSMKAGPPASAVSSQVAKALSDQNNVKIQTAAQASDTPVPAPTFQDALSTTAAIVFQQIPATSRYNNILDKIYGASGLNVSDDRLSRIKKTYGYLEFLVKIEKVKKDPKLLPNQPDFTYFFKPNADGTALIPRQTLVDSDAWKAIAVTDKEILESLAWQTFIKSTICDCMDSQASFILDNNQANGLLFTYLPNIETAYSVDDFTKLRFYSESMQLNALMQAEQQKQYMAQCIDWKNLNQADLLTAINAFKTTDFYKLMHTMPADPKNMHDQPQYKNIASPTKELIVAYYLLVTITSDLDSILTLDNVASFLYQASSSTLAPNFFMHTPTDLVYLNDYLTLKDLTEQNKLHPQPSNAFMTPDANVKVQSIQIDDDDADDTSEIEDFDSVEDLDTPQAEVVIQKIKNPFTKKNFEKAGKAIDKAVVKPVEKAVVKPAVEGFKEDIIDPTQKAIVDPAAAGFKKNIEDPAAKALNPVFKEIKRGFYDDFVAPSNAALDPAKNGVSQGFAKGMTEMMKGMAVATDAIATDVVFQFCASFVFVGCGIASLFDPHIDPFQERQAALTKMNKQKHLVGAIVLTVIVVVILVILCIVTLGGAAAGAAGAVAEGAVAAGDAVLATGAAISTTATAISASVAAGTVIADTTVVLSAAAMALLPTMTVMGAVYAVAVVGTIAIGIAAAADPQFAGALAKNVLLPFMLGMEAMTDAFTTGLIDLSVSFTWIGAGFGQFMGLPVNAAQEAAKTRANMEKYRSTINIVMSVVLTVVITVVVMMMTAGVGYYYAAYLDSYAASAEAAAVAAEAAADDAYFAAMFMSNDAEYVTASETAQQTAMTARAAATTARAAATAAKAGAAVGATEGVEQITAQTGTKTAAGTGIEAGAEVSTAGTEAGAGAELTTGASAEVSGTTAETTTESAAKTATETTAQTGTKTAAESQAKTATQEELSYADRARKLMGYSTSAENNAAKMAAQKEFLMASDDLAAANTTEAKAAAQARLDQASQSIAKLGGSKAQQAVDQATVKLALKQEAEQAAQQAVVNGQDATGQGLSKAITERQAAQAEYEQATTKLSYMDKARQGMGLSTSADKQAAEEVTRVAAQRELLTATDNLATKQAAEKAAQIAVNKGEEGAAEALARATTERELAETQAEQASQAVAKIGGNQTQQAADQAAAKLAIKQDAEKAAQLAVENNEPGAGQALAKATAEREAAEIEAEQTASAAEKETARLAARSSWQIGKESDSLRGAMWTALKNGTMNWGFLIGQALNAGFGVFSAMAAVDQDEAAADALEAERKSIQALWSFVEDNKVSLVHNQTSYLDELHKKHQMAVGNQAFGLQYYSNFLNSSVNNVQNQIAQALAQQYIQMLTPDANGLRIADIGSTWGLQTQFDYLYPAQGFMSTTLGRPDFPYAQEVAQAPLASEVHGDTSADLSDKQPAATKLWFNQRAVSVINQAPDKPLNVEIKFRVIYNLTTAYHVGLYLGGNYHDYNSAAYLQSIQDQGSIDLDEANLAKMFVLKRDDEKSAPSIGLYEHEGKGWITQQHVDANILNSASIYHMSANLNKDQLTVSFWPENNPAAKWNQTMTVNPCDQRTFGVIFSGIAIEWDVVQPSLSITQNKTARSASNGQSEADREKASRAQWKQLLNPKFGSMSLVSSGRPALLQGQYLYTTQSTGIVDADGAPITDYVVFATSAANNVTAIGANPAPTDASKTPNAIVSLITGNVYNSAGKIITRKQNALAGYAQSSTSISQSLGEAIAAAGQQYQQQLLQYTFGNYQLTALSADAINNGLYIYTCPTTISSLAAVGKKPIKDASGKPVLDYLIMADLVNNTLGSSVGMPPSSTVQGMISLVTGNVYSKTSDTPIDSGYSILTQYTKQYGKLPQDLSNTIVMTTLAYNKAQAAQTPPKTTQVSVVASQIISLTDLMNDLPPTTGGLQFGLSSDAPSNIVATNASISKLQTSAAGSAMIDFGSLGAPGLNFGEDASTNVGSAASMNVGSPQTENINATIPAQQTQNVQEPTANATDTTTFATSDVGLGGMNLDNGSQDGINSTTPNQNQQTPVQQNSSTAPAQQNSSAAPAQNQSLNYSTFTLAGDAGLSF